MERRTYLTAAGAVTTAFLGGCVSDPRSGDAGPGKNTDTDDTGDDTDDASDDTGDATTDASDATADDSAGDDAPDDPEDAFEDPIVDENGDVVEEVDWEFDQETGGQASDVEWARVVLTDSPGVEADTVRVESTIAEWEFELSGEGRNGWAGSWVNVGLHPDGDQVVVTIVDDGSEEVVHRVHYDP